ncbi:MAG: tRNA-dihydrouridine synthase, partial [Pseudomonadota bacterium]
PPLDYPLVYAMKRRRPDLSISLNGGVTSLTEARTHLAHVDGVMIGRAAYGDPAGILGGAGALITGEAHTSIRAEDAVRGLYPYIEAELSAGTKLHQITRHMLGAFNGRPGARAWRRVLSDGAHRPGAGIALIERALSEISPAVQAAE